mmetsp:Transcript_30177/g.59075  ORF Transcript_30177/g.59075 Transcript_30177/m.59075 type:complete len:207 (-) Transcript_30177:199-819(-)
MGSHFWFGPADMIVGSIRLEKVCWSATEARQGPKTILVVLGNFIDRSFTQLAVDPELSEFHGGVVKVFAFPAHEIKNIIRLVEWMEDAIKDALFVAVAFFHWATTWETGGESMKNRSCPLAANRGSSVGNHQTSHAFWSGNRGPIFSKVVWHVVLDEPIRISQLFRIADALFTPPVDLTFLAIGLVVNHTLSCCDFLFFLQLLRVF